MELAFSCSPLYPPPSFLLRSTSTRRWFLFNNYNCCNNFNVRRLISISIRRKPSIPISMAITMPSAQAAAYDSELENKKHKLLTCVQDTQRGLLTTPQQRSSIEEALVNVEGCNMGDPINLAKLDGTWRLQYTSAPDVLILFQAAASLPFFQELAVIVARGRDGTISCYPVVETIHRDNICHIVKAPANVKWKIRERATEVAFNAVNSLEGAGVFAVELFLTEDGEEQEGATLLVSAKFTVVSVRNIYLQFQEIALQDINISEQLQALIAPAILPRSFISLQILQYLRGFKAQIPVRDPARESVGGLYYLSYLDDNMLLGRAVGGGGVFVFTRAQSLY